MRRFAFKTALGLFALFVLSAFAAPAADADEPRLLDLRIGDQSGGWSRIVFEISAPPDFQVIEDGSGGRLAVAFDSLRAGPEALPSRIPSGFVGAVRIKGGGIVAGPTQVTFDLSGPGKLRRTALWGPSGSVTGYRLVIDLDPAYLAGQTATRALTATPAAVRRSRAEPPREQAPREKSSPPPPARQAAATAPERSESRERDRPPGPIVRERSGQDGPRFAFGVPEGFEDLTAEQQVLYDIYYAGRRVGQAMAETTPSSFRFMQPGQVTAMIEDLSDPAAVEQALSGQLAPHSNRVCRRRGVPEGCGQLSPEVAGIIADPDNLRADLFIDPAFLTEAPDVVKRTPYPDTGFGTTLLLDSRASGRVGDEVNYNFRALTGLAYNGVRASAITDVNNSGVQVDEIFAETLIGDYELKGGMFRSERMPLVGEREVLGGRVAKTFKAYVDPTKVFATPVEIFLPRRARVEVYRDGRLLDARVYESGNVSIDTSRFPNGVYNVTLRIIDPVTGEREETRLFSRTAAIPPGSGPVFSIEGGVLQERGRQDDLLPDFTDVPFVRGRVAWRIMPSVVLESDVLASDEEIIGAIGFLKFGQGYQLSARGLFTQDGDVGAEVFLNASWKRLGASLSYQQLWLNGPPDPGNLFIREEFAQLSGQLQFNLSRLQVGSRGRYVTRGSGVFKTTDWLIAPFFGYSFNLRGFTLNLEGEYSMTDEVDQALLRLRLFRNYADYRITGAVSGRYDSADNRFEPEIFGDLTFLNRPFLRGSLDTSFIGRASDEFQSLQFRTDYDGSLADLNGFIEQNWRTGTANTLFGVNSQINFAGDSQGFAAGGGTPALGAIIVEIRGEDDGGAGQFEILLNRQRQAVIGIGGSRALMVPPYREHEIRIRPIGTTSADYDGSTRTVAVYPTATQRLVWEIRRVYLFVGLLIGPDGTPLPNAIVETQGAPGLTNEDGYLQAELESNSIYSVSKGDRAICEFTTPGLSPNQQKQAFVFLEEIRCE